MGRNQGSKPKDGAQKAGRKTNAEREKIAAQQRNQADGLARMLSRNPQAQPSSKRPRVSGDQSGEGSSAGARSASSAGDVDVIGDSGASSSTAAPTIGESTPPPAGTQQQQSPPGLDDEGDHSRVDREEARAPPFPTVGEGFATAPTELVTTTATTAAATSTAAAAAAAAASGGSARPAPSQQRQG
ncbi:unnamed protein product [Ectocarpus sp. 6 AP-2014]